MILITGGLGFLGVNLAKYLLDLGEQVLLTRNRNLHLPTLLTSYLDKGLQVTPMDITQLSTVLEAIRRYRVTSVVHAAAIYEGRGTLYQVVDANVMGSANVLEAARLLEVGRVTFVSSEGVYQGRPDRAPLKEEEYLWARSDRFIPATKKMAELLCFVYQKAYQMDLVITRPSRIYGPFYAAGRNPILRMAKAALMGSEVDLGAINGQESHDFLYVRDCSRALALIHLAKQPKEAIYNIGFGKLHSFGDVARTLEKIVPGTSLKLGSGSCATITKTAYDIHTCLDITRIQAEFGFVPEYDLEKGLAALVAWIKDEQYI